MRLLGSILISLPLLALGASCKNAQSTKSSKVAMSDNLTKVERCDVIVVGGSTAGVAAAIAAAREFEAEGVLDGRRRVVCLLEPTDWAGGQLTASGVPAVDFAHHKVPDGDKKLNLSRLTRDPANNSRVFADWMNAMAPATNGAFEMGNNPGKCWVSVRCFEPKRMVDVIHGTLAGLEAKGHLKVFFNTVPKRLEREGNQITALQGIRRSPVGGVYAWNRRLSSVIVDWYSDAASNVFTKEIFTFRGPEAGGKPLFPIFVDGTEWGEILALSGASYLQGVEASESTPHQTNDDCGQAIVFPLAVELKAEDVPLPGWFANSIERYIEHPDHYSINEPGRNFTWDGVWSYRRLRLGSGESGGPFGVPMPGVGDVSSQNWTLGNDYPYKYLFFRKSQTGMHLFDWVGGVDLSALDAAEVHALGWFKFLREQAPRGLGSKLALSDLYGTANGLAKVPYIRDTRRSIGVGDFVLKYEGGIFEGMRFEDTIAIGAYAADVHETKNPGCTMPAHIDRMDRNPRPFYLPFRAHTNKDIENLLVSGKLMAQTFAANSATRLHPIEFSSGTGVGVAAALMQRWQAGSARVSASAQAIKDIQSRITALHGPIEFQNLDAARE